MTGWEVAAVVLVTVALVLTAWAVTTGVEFRDDEDGTEDNR